jgi:hypothetical protein
LVALLAGFASRAMELYCNRDWASHDDTANGIEYDVGPQHQRMIRIKGPVITISSVETRDGPSDTYSTLDSTLYVAKNFPQYGPVATSNISHLKKIGFGMYEIGRLPRYAVTRIGSTEYLRWRTVFWRGYTNVRVKYTWGYSSIPEEINRICIFICDDWLKRLLKDVVGKRVKATTPEDLELIMRYEIPEHLMAALNGWRSTGGIWAV